MLIGRAKKAKGGQGASVVDNPPVFSCREESKAFYFRGFTQVDNSNNFHALFGSCWH